MIVMYRAPASSKNRTTPNDFINELSDMIGSYDIQSDDFIILGDFNIHFDCETSPNTKRIKALFNEHSLVQHVQTGTQRHGHILDWVISKEDALCSPVANTDEAVSDHHLIQFKVSMGLMKQPKSKCKVLSRNIKQIDLTDLKHDLSLELGKMKGDINATNFQDTTRIILDRHAPMTERVVKVRKKSSWFTIEVKRSKQEKRKAEIKWKKLGCVWTEKSIYQERILTKKFSQRPNKTTSYQN